MYLNYNRILCCIFLTVFPLMLFAQSKEDPKYYLASKDFKRNYKRTEYARFIGAVQEIDAETIQFNGQILKIYVDEVYKQIFLKGIFDMELLLGCGTTAEEEFRPVLTDEERAVMPEGEQLLHDLMRQRKTTISSFKTLEALNPDYKTRRYQFWLYETLIFNPTEYYIELYNKDARPGCDERTFIEGAVLTYFHRGSVII